MRTMTLTVLLALAAATTAAAQGRHELEVGAGWMQFNPLDIDDFTSIPSGPTLTVTRVGWREDERRGWAIGVTAVLTPQHVPHTVNTGYHFPLYGSVAYRWRWESDDGSDLIFGVGAGPMMWIRKTPLWELDPDTFTRSYTGETERELDIFLRPHIDVYGSRPIRDGLKIRYGVTWMPLLWIPLMVQPTVMGVWEF